MFTGQQHHVGITIDGIAYEIALGGEKDLVAGAGKPALPPGSVSYLWAYHWVVIGPVKSNLE